MRLSRFVIVVVGLCGLAVVGCGSDPAAPAAPSIPACQANNTATVVFQNKSVNSVYDVIWDGAAIDRGLAPGGATGPMTVAANVTHTLIFKYSNSNVFACSPSTPSLAQCSNETYWCTY